MRCCVSDLCGWRIAYIRCYVGLNGKYNHGNKIKFTRQHAENLAKENVIYRESIGNYVFCYMKALEETSAPDMLEALIKIQSLLKKRMA